MPEQTGPEPTRPTVVLVPTTRQRREASGQSVVETHDSKCEWCGGDETDWPCAMAVIAAKNLPIQQKVCPICSMDLSQTNSSQRNHHYRSCEKSHSRYADATETPSRCADCDKDLSDFKCPAFHFFKCARAQSRWPSRNGALRRARMQALEEAAELAGVVGPMAASAGVGAARAGAKAKPVKATAETSSSSASSGSRGTSVKKERVERPNKA